MFQTLPTLNKQKPEPQRLREDGALDVVKIFHTIQGEGPFAGTPAVFVRLGGCNLTCEQCFGTATKSRIPYLYASVGPKIRLDRVKSGDNLLTFDENMEVVETTVKSVLRREVRRWLEIKIAGKWYDVTPEHPFFTTRGIVSASELRVRDHILEIKPSDVISIKKLGDSNPMRDPEVAARSAASRDYAAISGKISETRRRRFESGELIPSFYTLSPERQEEVRQRQSEAKLGELNPNYKGEHPNLNDLKRRIRQGEFVRCANCGKKKTRLLVHHHDDDHGNDDIDNLAVWCHRCHNRHHQRGYNFWNGSRRDGKELVKKHNGQEVQAIRRQRGQMPVVNVSCWPYPSYFANGMWVHNCDTNYTAGRHTMKHDHVMLRVEELAGKHTPLVVLTGGEPFRQNIQPFVELAASRNYTVQVETNGTLFVEYLPYGTRALYVVCSPKTPQIHLMLLDHIDCLKYVLTAGEVDEKDGLPTSTLGNGLRPRRPWPEMMDRVWVQPADCANKAQYELNVKAAVDSCMKHGYRLSLQLHKYLGLE